MRNLTLVLGLTLLASAGFGQDTAAAVCPVSLTNPDGQALDLERYELRAAVHGPLALVEMEMTFHNPQPRQMEGRFLYVLPPGATISRFAKEVDGKLMEGEVVERMRAQRIYTQILHTMRDPALLEQDQGNRFSARVFPIPANGYTRLLLSYSQILSPKNDTRRLTVPLTGLPQMKSFTATLVFQDLPESAYHSSTYFGKIEKTETQPQFVTRTVTDFKPEEDLVVDFSGLKDPHHATVIRAGNYQMTAYRPEGREEGQTAQRAWCFYLDTSASSADSEQRRLEALNQLYPKTLIAKHTTQVWGFDLDVVPVLKQAANQNWIAEGHTPPEKALHQFLRARHSLGATNLECALKHIGEQARATEEPTRFVLVSDGIATFGAREPRDLVAALGEWPEQHVLHALVLGPKQDQKTLSAIVEKTRGRIVTISLGSDMEQSVEQAIAELQKPVGASFEFYDENAEWIYPKSFRDVRPGDELVVFSRVKDGATAKPGVIQREASGKVVKDTPLAAPPREAPAFAPLLEREACAAYLNFLEKLEQETTNQTKIDAVRKLRVETSIKHRVLCPLTSLLVLETEEDYARFEIDRKALADVMIVGNKGIEMRQRTALDQPVKRAERPHQRVRDALKEMKEEEKLVEGGTAVTFVQNALSDSEEATGEVFGGNGTPAEPQEELTRAALSQDMAVARSERAAGGRAEADAAPLDVPSTPPPPRPVVAQEQQQAAPEPNARVDRRKPEWTAQYGARPKDDELNALRTQVAATPRDRNLRNSYADALVKKQDWDALQALAFEWLPFDPENPQVYEFLGKSATRLGDTKTALRAFTSIAEIAPNRAALLARSGWLLLIAEQHEMAAQLFREALKNRDDDPNLYRGLALACWQKGDFETAADTLEGALKQKFNERYGDVKRVLSEELGYVYRAWLKAVRTHADDTHPRVQKRAQDSGVKLDRIDALRVTLGWETDANDVDLHVVDPAGEECYYEHLNTKSGLELYSDQTQGLGPEVIRCSKLEKGVYHVGVNYFSAGPMGVSRGVIVILRSDADGNVERPQIIPFCLVDGGADMRHLAAVVVP